VSLRQILGLVFEIYFKKLSLLSFACTKIFQILEAQAVYRIALLLKIEKYFSILQKLFKSVFE